MGHPIVEITGVKVENLPPDHTVIWVGRFKRHKNFFVVTMRNKNVLAEKGDREVTDAVLWIVDPTITLARFGEEVYDCRHCHLYGGGSGGMVEAGPYTITIPMLDQDEEYLKSFEVEMFKVEQ